MGTCKVAAAALWHLLCPQRRMTRNLANPASDGRRAFADDVPLSGNPYSSLRSEKFAAISAGPLWESGWLRAQANHVRAQLERRRVLLRETKAEVASAIGSRWGREVRGR